MQKTLVASKGHNPKVNSNTPISNDSRVLLQTNLRHMCFSQFFGPLIPFSRIKPVVALHETFIHKILFTMNPSHHSFSVQVLRMRKRDNFNPQYFLHFLVKLIKHSVILIGNHLEFLKS